MRLTDDVASGDERRALEALRDLLAATLELSPPTATAALAKQLRETLARLEALRGAAASAPSAVDEIAAARRLRRHSGWGVGAAAWGPVRAPGMPLPGVGWPVRHPEVSPSQGRAPRWPSPTVVGRPTVALRV